MFTLTADLQTGNCPPIILKLNLPQFSLIVQAVENADDAGNPMLIALGVELRTTLVNWNKMEQI